MILGKKDKDFLAQLQKDITLIAEENKKLVEENNKIKAQAKNIDQILKLLADLNGIGAGLIEVRRIHPDSFFLVSP